MRNPITEGLKEMARNLAMAAIPVLIAGINMQTGELKFDVRVLVATLLLTLLTGVDRWLHVKGSNENPNGKFHGLVKM